MQSINSHNIDSEDENLIASIEKKIQDQTHSEIEFTTSANGRLNILQDIQLSPPKPRNPKDQFSRLYPNIKELLVELPTKFSNKYDYHLFRLPKNIDPQPLLNMEINIHEENKIVCGDKKFIIKPTTKVPSPGLIVPENIILNFKSNIVMEKYVKTRKQPKLEYVEKKHVSLPNDLKNRHPLFGSNFEDKIELDEEIKMKLDAAINSSWQKDQQKEKKSKKKKKNIRDQTQDDEVIFNLLNGLGTPSKKKKSSKDEPLDDSSTIGQDTIPVTKKKDRKTKQSIIEETLRNLKFELLTEYETDTAEKSHKQKHKKKRSSNERTDSNIPDIKQDVSKDIWSAGLSKKEKRRLSIANSTLMMDISKQPKFDPDMSDISTVKDIKKKQKKNKRKSDGDEAVEYKKNKHRKEIY